MELKEIKCNHCGHVNPPGTQLCQSCGKMINEDYDKKKIKDLMRYDGSAVRSKVRSQSIFDKIWNFFTSIKVGVGIIAIIAIAAAIGTILPQEYFIPIGADPLQHYTEQYGTFGTLYYKLGFTQLYSSWWFVLLMGLLALSLIAASVDRGVPLYKSLKNQRAKKHASFFKRQRLFKEYESNENAQALAETFENKKYKLKTDGDHYLLEKGRLSRWGPYINHTGLIILLAGSMLRFFPGVYIDEIIYAQEGETVSIPTTDGQYYMRNDGFTLDTYDEDAGTVFDQSLQNNMEMTISNFQTDITMFENKTADIVGSSPDLEEIENYSIRVNHPYYFDDYELYQSSYDNSQMKSMTFRLEDSEGNVLGENFTVGLDDPADSYEITEDITINMKAYSPDFLEIDENGTLISETPVPTNPAFVFEVAAGDTSELSLLQIMNSTDITQDNEYSIKFVEAEEHMASVLTLKKDLSMPIIATGFVIFLIGLFIGSYINHRRIWINAEGDTMKIAAHTNKNYFGLKKEMNAALASYDLPEVFDKQEKEENDKMKG
ncbi:MULTISPECIES: cytochrome c biogenesis protein ResB [Jeotgalicoccus]|uniref:Cytochrome c biogenesis protein ResB n=1 Tax=Jeotgalicoccus nanhaiensis TaxID=568603 RepID=A0ABR9XX40_9STAP|nr:cytochrome c biogenesis protein ResB [Jeotgalicoccus nanhaiensis]MBF0753356.1 cytochrome c biogenesis protein ResB [Jeotgalicoccus nanhaiensis]TFU62520.1 cytochrome c biogenesis protein ResB [Jeotgalicoccus nanhaiensis]